MKSAKTKEKENRSFTGDPELSMNHLTAHKHYSYESWLRIWNPGLFLIRTRGPFFILFTKAETEPDGEGGVRPADGCCKERRGHDGNRPVHTYSHVHGLAAAGSCSAAAPAPMEAACPWRTEGESGEG